MQYWRGKTLSITAPRVEAQQEVILSAYNDAAFSPDTVTYMEAHGTGTSLGDPIEVEALTRAFREYIPRQLEAGEFEEKVLANIGDDFHLVSILSHGRVESRLEIGRSLRLLLGHALAGTFLLLR